MISAAMVETSACLTVLEEQLRILQAEDVEIDALGLDLEAMGRQEAADQREAAQDMGLLAQLTERVAVASTEAELAGLMDQGQTLGERTTARQARYEQRRQALAAVAAIRERYRAGGADQR